MIGNITKFLKIIYKNNIYIMQKMFLIIAKTMFSLLYFLTIKIKQKAWFSRLNKI